MADFLVRATAAGGNVRFLAAVSTSVVAEAARRHDTWPVATAALGRALTGAALLGAGLKGKGSVTLRIDGGGPLGGIIADADGDGNLRGYVRNPHVEMPTNALGKLDVGAAVGRDGFLYVTRDMGLRDMYTGTSALVSGEIAEDLTYYLWSSEQTPSAVALGVLIEADGTVRAAGGYLLQLMPATAEADRALLEQNLQALGSVSLAVDAGMTPEAMLVSVLAGMAPKVLDRLDLRFQCRCSPERAEGILVGLGAAELRHMLEHDGGAELRCEFCAAVYRFGQAELAELIARAEGG